MSFIRSSSLLSFSAAIRPPIRARSDDGDDVDADRRALPQQHRDLADHPAVLDVADQGIEGVPAVDEQHDVRGPLRRRQASAQLGAGCRRVRRHQLLAAHEFGGEPVEQPVEPFDVGARHHGAGVRQRGQHRQGTAGRVHGVEVHIGAGVGAGQRGGDGPQRLRPA